MDHQIIKYSQKDRSLAEGLPVVLPEGSGKNRPKYTWPLTGLTSDKGCEPWKSASLHSVLARMPVNVLTASRHLSFLRPRRGWGHSQRGPAPAHSQDYRKQLTHSKKTLPQLINSSYWSKGIQDHPMWDMGSGTRKPQSPASWLLSFAQLAGPSIPSGPIAELKGRHKLLFFVGLRVAWFLHLYGLGAISGFFFYIYI